MDARRQRADGLRSRNVILAAAAELASVEGLEGLSIGRLADHVGMSKSGLFAHFKSKEDLQIATIDTAMAIFQREVLAPGMQAPPGVARVLSQAEAFFSHLERRVFPGGCFFIAVAAELDARPGPVRDHLRAVFNVLLEGLTGVIREAQALGEIAPDEDLAQLTYEIDAFLIGANFAYLFFEDRAALDRGRRAIEARLARAAGPARATRRPSKRPSPAPPARKRRRSARHVARLTPACPPRPCPRLSLNRHIPRTR